MQTSETLYVISRIDATALRPHSNVRAIIAFDSSYQLTSIASVIGFTLLRLDFLQTFSSQSK